MPRRLLPTLLVASPLLVGGLCGPAPILPPEQPGDCVGPVGPTALEVGEGFDAFRPIAEGTSLALERGSQGGLHAWVAFRAAGFGSAPVNVEAKATDLYSGRTVAAGAVYETRLNRLAGEPDGSCELHGIQLFLQSRVEAAGLVNLTVSVSTLDGETTATARKQLWLGSPMPACSPSEGVAPELLPRIVSSEGEVLGPIVDGAVLTAVKRGPAVARLELLALTSGLAASALRLEARLIDAADETTLLSSGVSLDDAWLDPPESWSENVSQCAPKLSVFVPVTPELDGRAALLTLAGDDGLGHRPSATRRVTLRHTSLVEP